MRVERTNWRDNPKPLLDGRLAIAVGDVHGCAEHLEAMFQALAKDVARLKSDQTTCVLLGDLVDRGPCSLDCLGLALNGLAAFARGKPVEDVVLRGNHDEWLQKALDGSLNDQDVRVWVSNGGDVTFTSLGIPTLTDAAELSAAIQAKLPAEIAGLLSRMPYSHRIGDLLFVHAGIDPRRSLEDQTPHAQLWIRDAFLYAEDWPFEVLVVHGHTIDPPLNPPRIHPHRIGIDTGAFATGVLTAVEFLGSKLRFVTVDSR